MYLKQQKCEESAGDGRFGVGLPKINENNTKRCILRFFSVLVFRCFFFSAKRCTELKLGQRADLDLPDISFYENMFESKAKSQKMSKKIAKVF